MPCSAAHAREGALLLPLKSMPCTGGGVWTDQGAGNEMREVHGLPWLPVSLSVLKFSLLTEAFDTLTDDPTCRSVWTAQIRSDGLLNKNKRETES